MQRILAVILESRWFVLLARLALTFVFWTGGLAGIFDFAGRAEEMRAVGLFPAEAFVVAVVITELGGTALVLTNRWSWLGSGILGVFLALTIPIGHPFWTMAEPDRTASFYTVLEHISVIGGLMVAATLGRVLRTQGGG